MQEILEERDLYPVQEVLDKPVYASVPTLDLPAWQASHPAERVWDPRAMDFKRDSGGGHIFVHPPEPVILYRVRSDTSGWIYLHNLAGDKLVYSLPPDKQQVLHYADLEDGKRLQWVAGVEVWASGPMVRTGDRTYRVGQWTGQESTEHGEVSFNGFYAQDQPTGSWQIKYPRKDRVMDGDYTKPATYQQVTSNIQIKTDSLPEILNPQFHQ